MEKDRPSSPVLGLILARGGSQSIPKKNIALCAGKPLLYYTIQAALRSRLITRLCISTDSEEIASYARDNGVEVPYMQPSELATGTTPDLPVFQYAVKWFEENESYCPSVIVHLRPTTPLKKSDDIDRAIALLMENPEAHSVRSVCEPMHTPFKMYRRVEESPYLRPILAREFPEVYLQYPEAFNMPRQVLPTLWRHSGYVDSLRPDVIRAGSMSGSNILPFEIEKWRDVDIDTKRDLIYAEIIIRELEAQGKNPWD